MLGMENSTISLLNVTQSVGRDWAVRQPSRRGSSTHSVSVSPKRNASVSSSPTSIQVWFTTNDLSKRALKILMQRSVQYRVYCCVEKHEHRRAVLERARDSLAAYKDGPEVRDSSRDPTKHERHDNCQKQFCDARFHKFTSSTSFRPTACRCIFEICES